MSLDPSAEADPGLPLWPFFDLIVAVIGILILVFALHQAVEGALGRQLMIDDLIVCARDGTISYFAAPEAEPVDFSARQVPDLLEGLTGQAGGSRNLVFAVTADCFDTRRLFEEELARFNARLNRPDAERAVFRVAFRPLSSEPGATQRLLGEWRTTVIRDGP
ncbi:hypothetical protein ABC977_07635 [Thioalkalicoccus limnaeus]|uniref:Biopolymer transporter ExbD n=1 Tax=Thioalkalicoccus limnaeus TaxID=120681 RepID=A0ABV4BCP3_9GAMM